MPKEESEQRDEKAEASGTAATCDNNNDDISDLSSSDNGEMSYDDSDASSSSSEDDLAHARKVIYHNNYSNKPWERKIVIDDDDSSSSLSGDSSSSSDGEEAFMFENAFMSQDWKSAKLAIQLSKSNEEDAIYNGAANAIVVSRKKDDGNILPYLLISADWSKAKSLIQSHPSSAQKRDEKGKLPLYSACTNEAAPNELIAALIEAYPKALKEKYKGKLPIHAVLSIKRNDMSLRLVKHMIELYPESTTIRDDTYLLPIHRACCYGAPDQVVNTLYQSNPRITNEHKNLRYSESLDKGMRANIFGSMGNVHMGNGEYNLACDSYSTSLMLKKEVYGNEHMVVAKAWSKLSIAHRKLGKLSTAKEYLEESLLILNRVANDSDPELGDTMVQMGKILSKEKHFNKAHKYFISAGKVYNSAKIPFDDPCQANLRQLVRQNFVNASKTAKASRSRQSSRAQSYAIIG